MHPISSHVGKAEALRILAEAGGEKLNVHDGETAGRFLGALLATGAGLTNQDLRRRAFDDLGAGAVRVAQEASAQTGPAPVYLNGRPNFFPPVEPNTMWEFHSGRQSTLQVADGYLCLVGEAPTVFGSDRAMIPSYSSGFAGLAQFYDRPILPALGQSRYIDATTMVLIDDVWGLNYCHWILDWLPRLSALPIPRNELRVAITPVRASFQLETLRNCGILEEHIIEMDRWDVIQARNLIVPAHLSTIYHPAFKAAPWAIDFVRRTISGGYKAESQQRRLYISRGDAPNRRVLNELEVIERLRDHGFEPVTLSGHSVREQAELFGSAEMIVAPHGAGVTNIVFCSPGTKVVELFTRSYGMCTFWILAANLGFPYATYIMNEARGEQETRDHDVTVDVTDMMNRVGNFLGL